MSLSDCPCGGFIPLGPDASNRCERCGLYVMAEPPKPERKPMKLTGAITIQLDGTAWCATRDPFTNLQECAVGFGASEGEALANLLKDEA